MQRGRHLQGEARICCLVTCGACARPLQRGAMHTLSCAALSAAAAAASVCLRASSSSANLAAKARAASRSASSSSSNNSCSGRAIVAASMPARKLASSAQATRTIEGPARHRAPPSDNRLAHKIALWPVAYRKMTWCAFAHEQSLQTRRNEWHHHLLHGLPPCVGGL